MFFVLALLPLDGLAISEWVSMGRVRAEFGAAFKRHEFKDNDSRPDDLDGDCKYEAVGSRLDDLAATPQVSGCIAI